MPAHQQNMFVYRNNYTENINFLQSISTPSKCNLNLTIFFLVFQDVHVMIFIGIGFLMAFLKRYGYSSVGFTFLLGSFTVQWSVLCLGFYELNDDYKIELGIER